MNLRHQNILIRSANENDAPLLCKWWNDGSVMAHAGYPNGLGIEEDNIRKKIASETDDTCRRHIIMLNDEPIGEMNYRQLNETTCEIGIKICEAIHQNKGWGKQILSLFIQGLFHKRGYTKILLDTNLNNKRAQHVYETLGFKKLRINVNSWTDQLGIPQSSVDYELTEETFINHLF